MSKRSADLIHCTSSTLLSIKNCRTRPVTMIRRNVPVRNLNRAAAAVGDAATKEAFSKRAAYRLAGADFAVLSLYDTN